jgi:hypothetical protein
MFYWNFFNFSFQTIVGVAKKVILHGLLIALDEAKLKRAFV